jgi:hypothetical protein
MLDFLSTFDGSCRKPRAMQVEGLSWLSEGWATKQVHAINAPVGSGKSAMARAIQLRTGAAIVTPSNILIDQYIGTYPKANFLKGKRHYSCVYSGLTCGDWIDVEEQEPCVGCPYQKAKSKAKLGEPTFFNPMSLYHVLHRMPERPKTMVVDEAHLLGPMLVQLCSKRFPKSIYGFPDVVSHEKELSTWLGDLVRKLEKLITLYEQTKAPKDKIKEACDDFEQVCIVKECLDAEPQNYAIWVEQGTYRGRPDSILCVEPVRVPWFMVRRLLNCDRLVLLSGTLLKTDIEDLATGKAYRYLDLPSPIPKDRRPIRYRPMPFPVNRDTDPAKMVEQIEKALARYPLGTNTIIHTTYDRMRKMAPHFKRKILTNTPETKNAVLEQFKKEGGVWLAAGCAEGLDLKGDLCRLNIIPHLLRPNLGSPVVKKWVALPGGKRRYALETIKTTVQQYGRSTRDPEDESSTEILDPGFGNIVNTYRNDIPRYFTEAIDWRA